jgi:hypothetical protein
MLLAAVLFFADTSAKFDQRCMRQSSFFFAIVRMFMLPVF